ncbi:MAG: hypothetical protein NT007_02170 [Candidatus Kapabacteria bacterium]|nr:hypothetical protein [Candidatus Kapabacteria bacterium]
MTRKCSFHTLLHAGITFQYQSGDSCIRTNDSLQVGNDINSNIYESGGYFWEK